MTEMIIPGTYIAVRAEGLISAGRIATGIVGVVGTAASGPIGQPITLAGFTQARELFGLPDTFDQPADGANPLTLVRSLEQLYNNGASTVIAVRVAGSSRSSATYDVQNANGDAVATLTAISPGTWGNEIQVEIDAAENPCRIVGETHTTGFDQLKYGGVVPSPENQIRVFRGVTRRSQLLDAVYKPVVYGEDVVATADGRFFLTGTPVESVASVNQVVVNAGDAEVRAYGDGAILYGAGDPPEAGEIRINDASGEITFAATEVPTEGQTVEATYAVGHDAPLAGQVLITTWNGQLDFAPDEAPNTADGDRLTANYLIDAASCVQLTLTHDTVTEVYTTRDGDHLATVLDGVSQLVTATASETQGGDSPQANVYAFFGTGTNTPGSNGAEAGATEYAMGLEGLSDELVNIVVLAGQDAKAMGSVLLGHLKSTAQTDYERIGVIGAPGGTVSDFLGHDMADGRVVLVGPGMTYPDGSTLPPAYTAAAVAGLISSLPVQTSLTNKSLNVPGLTVNANRGQQGQLIKRNVLTVVRKLGYRVLKGVTTGGEGNPFAAIPTRRIVDYAKYGVRSAANPYIGRLNNARVRGAMKATLDAFLTRMVEDEALTGYELEVTATRAQEIAGEVNVTMTLQPTFSIDFIRVTMNLK